MFGLRLITRREILLWQATLQDHKEEIIRLRLERDRERERAEGAINALLAKSAGLVVAPKKVFEDELDRSMDVFNDENQDKEQAKLMEQIQS